MTLREWVAERLGGLPEVGRNVEGAEGWWWLEWGDGVTENELSKTVSCETARQWQKRPDGSNLVVAEYHHGYNGGSDDSRSLYRIGDDRYLYTWRHSATASDAAEGGATLLQVA